MTKPNLPLTDRISPHVNKFGPFPKNKKLGRCWIWTAAVASGYGVMRINKHNVKVHRLLWEIYCGPIPRGMFACHACDTKNCVRLSHLFLGTLQDNLHDAMKKKIWRPPSHLNAPKGKDHHWAKLTEAQVIEIRKKYAAGGETYRSLASQYNTVLNSIAFIIRRVNWRHLP